MNVCDLLKKLVQYKSHVQTKLSTTKRNFELVSYDIAQTPHPLAFAFGRLYHVCCSRSNAAFVLALGQWNGKFQRIFSFYFTCVLTTGSLDLVQGVPRAIVHIGPHKAASTHIQTRLFSLHKDLAGVNYHWPTRRDGAPVSHKGIAEFAFALKGVLKEPEHEIEAMSSFFQESLALNRNIILSSEEFDNMNKTQVAALRHHLKGFNVTIVFVYRDFIGQLVSRHFQSNRFDRSVVHFSQSFSAFLFAMLDNLPTCLDPIGILKTFAAEFGTKNLRIIDLMGTVVAKQPLLRVLLCEIGGVLCGYDKYMNYNGMNAAFSLLPAQVFTYYKNYVQRQNNGSCSFCGSLHNEYPYFSERYVIQTKLHPPPATTVTKLTLLLPYAEKVDVALRATYGSVLFYGNQTANFQAMGKTRVEEVNTELFLTDVYWNNYLHSEYQAALSGGRLCGC